LPSISARQVTIERRQTYNDIIEIQNNGSSYIMSTPRIEELLASRTSYVDIFCQGKGIVGDATYSEKDQTILFDIKSDQFSIRTQTIANLITPPTSENEEHLEKSAVEHIFINPNNIEGTQDIPIFSLGTYYKKSIAPKNETFSNDILILKNDFYSDLQQEIIDKFSTEIAALLHKNHEFVVCLMPNSSLGFNSSGLYDIAKKISIPPIIDGTRVLKRIHELQPKHLHGPRDYQKEIASLQVMNPDLIKNRIVLLLDDVTTTGISLRAGRDILLKADAKDVVLLALGKTYHSDNSGEKHG